jgi:hypothetical protein
MSGERRPPALLNFAIADLPRATFVERIRFQLDRLPAITYGTTSTRNDWQTFFAENGELHGFDRGVRIFVFDAGKNRSVFYFRTTTQAFVPFGVHEMEVWHKGKISRHIRSLQEERGWGFLNNGAQFAFENTEDFRKRRIKDRFNRSRIESYCPEFGIRLSDVYSYPRAGTLIQTAAVSTHH